jgi:enamine deaminase RidA (YjgF/YER057c/UK114 family)
MRMFGLAGLLLALVIAGVVAKKQMASVAAPALPSVPASGEVPADARTQARQVQQQVKEALDAAAQARKMPDDN